jgi:glycosyltransferase involved in cell wall biosynthesis
MRIGYILPENDFKLNLRPWVIQEIHELKHRGHDVQFIRTNSQDIEFDVDFIMSHYLGMCKYTSKFNKPYGTIIHGNGPSVEESIKFLNSDKNCKWVGHVCEFNRKLLGDKIQVPQYYTPVCARINQFKREQELGDRVICGARLIPIKGIDISIKAWPDVWVYGEEQTSNKTYVNYLKSLSSTATFVGWKLNNDLKEFLETGWCYLFTGVPNGGREEMCPTTIKEALLMEMQVVGSKVGGVTELEGVKFVDPFDVDGTREAILSLDRKRNIHGREYVVSKFTPQLSIDRYLKAIEETL